MSQPYKKKGGSGRSTFQAQGIAHAKVLKGDIWQVQGPRGRHELGRGKWNEVRPERQAGTRTCSTLETMVRRMDSILCAVEIHRGKVIGRGQRRSDVCVKKITMAAGWRRHHTRAMEETVSPVKRPQWELSER